MKVRNPALKVRTIEVLGIEQAADVLQDDEEVTFKHGKVTFSMLKSEIYSEEPYSPEELEAMKKESYYCIQTKIAEQLDFLRAHPNTPVSRYLVKKCEILQGIQTQKYRLASGESVSEVVKELSQPWSDPEKKQQYRTLCNKLKNGLAAVKDKTISTSTIQELLVHVNILESKYRAELEPKRSKKAVRGPWPKTAEEAKELMRGPAEIERPWCEPPTPAPSILFRTWDAKSQCRILNADEGLYSGGANSNFDTRKGRTRDLESHGNWGTRKPTVFISVTCSIRDIAMTWTRAFGNRQDLPFSTIRITVLNPNARIEAGWPILCMVDELDYYKFKTPIKCSRATYVNEYLLPYRAPREEVVWTFHWTDVERWMREHHTQDADMWRDRLAQPLLDVHERLRKAGKKLDEIQAELAKFLQGPMPYAVRTYLVGTGGLLG